MILVQKERIVVFMMTLRYGTVPSISTLKRVGPTCHGENGSNKSAVSSHRHHTKKNSLSHESYNSNLIINQFYKNTLIFMIPNKYH
jgi:hypothetical protein